MDRRVAFDGIAALIKAMGVDSRCRCHEPYSAFFKEGLAEVAPDRVFVLKIFCCIDEMNLE